MAAVPLQVVQCWWGGGVRWSHLTRAVEQQLEVRPAASNMYQDVCCLLRIQGLISAAYAMQG